MKPRLYAWAHALTPLEVETALKRFPGLGAVLYPNNYTAAQHLTVPPIAYVTHVTQAETVRAWIDAGVAFRAVVVNDERNVTGPSGHYLTPAEYATSFQPIYDILRGIVPVHTMGLSPKGGLLREVFRARVFDDWYHRQLPDADGRAFNPNGVRLAEVQRVLSMDGPWVLSPAPFRTWWERMLEPIKLHQWRDLALHENVTAVALWCLKETTNPDGTWQHHHGLIDRHDRITNVGRAVLNALEGG